MKYAFKKHTQRVYAIDLRIELQRIRFGDSIPSEVDLVRVKDFFTFLMVKNIYV